MGNHMEQHARSIPADDDRSRSMARGIMVLAEEAYNLGLLSPQRRLKQTLHLSDGAMIIMDLCFLSREQADQLARQNPIVRAEHPEPGRFPRIIRQGERGWDAN